MFILITGLGRTQLKEIQLAFFFFFCSWKHYIYLLMMRNVKKGLCFNFLLAWARISRPFIRAVLVGSECG